MRFEEPKILIQFARQCSEQIASDGVAEIIRLLDGGAQSVGMMRHVVHKKFQHGRAIGRA